MSPTAALLFAAPPPSAPPSVARPAGVGEVVAGASAGNSGFVIGLGGALLGGLAGAAIGYYAPKRHETGNAILGGAIGAVAGAVIL